MRVLNYQAHHVLGVSKIDFDLAGRHLFLVGGNNGEGKSSSLKALLMALCGKRDMDWPEIALKTGEDEGWVKVELSGDDELHEPEKLTLELLLKRKRNGAVVEQFRILDSAGEEAPEPRTLLKRLYHLKGFDPQEFDRQSKAERRKTLMELCGLDFREDEVQLKRLYDERTHINREHKATQAELKTLPQHDDAPEEEVSAADLMTELERRQKNNAEMDRLKKVIKRDEDEHRVLGSEVARHEEKVVELQHEIQKLKERIILRQEETKATYAKVAKFTLLDVDEVKTQIREAGAVNAKVRGNKRWAEVREKVQDLSEKSENLTASMVEIKAEQEQALRDAEWPIDGLSVDADGVIYNDLPYEQSSKSERILVSTMIGMALNPTLRLLVCEDGGDLDTATLGALDKLLTANDFQMLVELVTRTPADEALCAVVIEAGKVK